MLRSIVLAGAMLTMAMASALAQGQPSETTETFGNWTVRCRQAADVVKTCELVHAVPGQGGVIAQIAIGTPPGKDKAAAGDTVAARRAVVAAGPAR